MIGEHELIVAVGYLEAEVLQRWIDLDWVRPLADGDELRFNDEDVARVRLICDLHYELKIEESGLSVVLSLMDQLYAARRDLRRLAVAIKAQPDDVRSAIAKLTLAES